MSWTTLNDAFVACLRNSSVSSGQTNTFDWGKQPYFEEAPEGERQFPFVAFSFPSDSEVTPTFSGAYDEIVPIQVRVYAQADLYRIVCDPRAPTENSVIAYLDSLWANQPNIQTAQALFGGTSFQTAGWWRKTYRLYESQYRGPDGGRVWVGEANYWWMINSTFPTNP